MAEVKYVSYQENTILSVDFSELQTEFEVSAIITKVSQIAHHNRNPGMLVMYDFANLKMTPLMLGMLLKLFKQFGHKVKRRAFIIKDERLHEVFDHFIETHKIKGKIFTISTAAMNYLAGVE